MTHSENNLDKRPVLIVGGGPVGLTVSLLLSRYNVPHVLVERHPGTAYHPKAMAIMLRTAEIFRSLGVEEDIRELGVPDEWCRQIVWSEGLKGEILGQFAVHAEDGPGKSISPTRPIRSPQTVTEAVLFEKACAMEQADIRFSTQMEEFEDTGDCVRVKLLDRLTGETEMLECDYLIGADGHRSTIRSQLDISYEGPDDLGHFLGIYHRADYGHIPPGRRAFITNMLRDGQYGSIVSVNGADLWVLHLDIPRGDDPYEYTAGRCIDALKRLTGVDTDYEIISIGPWVMGAQTANTFSKGRVYLTGDAAHRTTPAGGLGMNTGIQSAHNLTWKIAAVVNGWAGESLLDTYESERRRVVEFNTGSSVKKAAGMFHIFELAANGQIEELQEALKQQYKTGRRLGQDIGYHYETGAIVSDGTQPPASQDLINEYEPVARPGHRAPHFWLERTGERFSSLDLFSGQGFVLLTGSAGHEWADAARAAADETRIPLGVSIVEKPGGVLADADGVFEGLYDISEEGAVLVRPDGIVAWRSKEASDDPAAEIGQALKTLTGRS